MIHKRRQLDHYCELSVTSYSGGGISKRVTDSSSWIDVPFTLAGEYFSEGPGRCASRMLFTEREVRQDAGVPVSGVPAGVWVSEKRSVRSRMEGGLVGSEIGADEMELAI